MYAAAAVSSGVMLSAMATATHAADAPSRTLRRHPGNGAVQSDTSQSQNCCWQTANVPRPPGEGDIVDTAPLRRGTGLGEHLGGQIRADSVPHMWRK